MANINIGLTYNNPNMTKLSLILNQNLQLSTCPPKNYSITFYPFNNTQLYQSPLGLNSVQNLYLIFGPSRYFGPAFYGFNGTSTDFKFKSAYLPSYSLDLQTRYNVMIAVLNFSMQNDNVKAAIFILNGSLVDPMAPWKLFNPHIYLMLFDGSLTVFNYNNSDDAVRICIAIKAMGATNIVMDLNLNASLLVLDACNNRTLLNWRQRWMIYFSMVPSENLKIDLPLSSNLTFFDFGRLAEFASFTINSETDVYLYDICYTLVKLMDFQNCNATMPSILNGGSGTFAYTGNEISRSTWVIQAYQYVNTMQKIGNVTVTSNGSIAINVPIISNIRNRTTLEILTEMRSKPFRIAAMLESPFVYYDNNTGALTGYSIDTMKRVLSDLNLTGVITAYNLSTGTLRNGQFSGILGVLQMGLTDIVIGPITSFPSYMNYFNFTINIKPYQLAIIYNSTDLSVYQVMFEFIFAFSYEVWILIVGSCFVYAILLTLVNMISPNEANMGLLDTFFLTMGSLVQGVTTALPDKVSGRILVIFWWILNICILLAYVANYGANRASVILQAPIRSFATLLQQTKYSYGTVINSSVAEFLALSTDADVLSINSNIRTVYLQNMMNSTNNSMGLVQGGTFAFIYQDAVLKQYLTLKCLVLTPGFFQFYYSYALIDSDYTTVINNALSALISSNTMAAFDAKYFGPVLQPQCTESNWLGSIFQILNMEFLTKTEYSLNIQQTSGIFIVMLVGIIISMIMAICELIYRKCSKKEETESEA